MKIVVAIGGNALGNNVEHQKQNVKITAKSIANLVESGHQIVLVHGNGPQVGMINKAFEGNGMPFPECGAMSQGYIGFHLQNAIKNEFLYRGIQKEVTTILTQIKVDKNDPAFSNPTKPIGSFLSLDEAQEMKNKNGYHFVEDSGRGFRRVIASPKPVDVIEKKIIKELFESDKLIIAAGGGGIPVILEGNELKGVDAVIDKDYAAAKIAELVESDLLLILTAVNCVKLHYGTKEETNIKSLNLNEIEKYTQENHFKVGSMKPKVEACRTFIKNNKTKLAIIASLHEADSAVKKKSGTIIKYL